MEMEQKVELINEKEMLALARDFEFETPLFGFFFKDGEGHRIDMFPGYCRHCQESEVVAVNVSRLRVVQRLFELCERDSAAARGDECERSRAVDQRGATLATDG